MKKAFMLMAVMLVGVSTAHAAPIMDAHDPLANSAFVSDFGSDQAFGLAGVQSVRPEAKPQPDPIDPTDPGGSTDPTAIPEPASLMLLGTGLIALARVRFTRRPSKA